MLEILTNYLLAKCVMDIFFVCFFLQIFDLLNQSARRVSPGDFDVGGGGISPHPPPPPNGGGGDPREGTKASWGKIHA